MYRKKKTTTRIKIKRFERQNFCFFVINVYFIWECEEKYEKAVFPWKVLFMKNKILQLLTLVCVKCKKATHAHNQKIGVC